MMLIRIVHAASSAFSEIIALADKSHNSRSTLDMPTREFVCGMIMIIFLEIYFLEFVTLKFTSFGGESANKKQECHSLKRREFY